MGHKTLDPPPGLGEAEQVAHKCAEQSPIGLAPRKTPPRHLGPIHATSAVFGTMASGSSDTMPRNLTHLGALTLDPSSERPRRGGACAGRSTQEPRSPENG